MKEIYDEQNKNNKKRSRSKSSRGNEYSSSESIDNTNLLSKSNSISIKSQIKSSIINTKNKEYSKSKINEASFSHKKPDLQNKLFVKYQNGYLSKI
jgi:hypothetical protein